MIGVRHLVHHRRWAASSTPPSSASPSRTSCASSSAAWCGRASRCAGRMAHGAMPEAGVNPISRARRAARARRPRSSAGCGRLCDEEPLSAPADRDPDGHPGAAPGAGRAAVERHPRRGPGHARHATDPGHRRGRGRPRRSTIACQRAMAALPGAKIEWEPVNGFRLATTGRARRGRWCEPWSGACGRPPGGRRGSAGCPAPPTAPSSG